MNVDFELYEGKTYSSLLQDIVKNHKSKQSRIKALTDQLVEMVSEPGEAVIIVPLIKEYLEADIKNDEALVKLAQIMQKGAQPKEGESGLLSDKDLELLFSDIQKTTVEDLQVKELPSSVK
jgi:hypothetical protein